MYVAGERSNEMMQPVVIAVHGGAGDIPDERVAGKLRGVLEAVAKGRRVLASGGTAVQAVEAAVRLMEADENFNAGRGSVLTSSGTVEMEAAVMEGHDMRAGAVTLVRDVPHPVTAARLTMEHGEHVLLGAHGADHLCELHNVPRCPSEQLVTEWARKCATGRTEMGGSSGTVGAVAVDLNGDVAAATSTGGMSGKPAGRIGDTPQLGAGTYADNASCAVSATGHGETILRWAVAARLCVAVEGGEQVQQAAERVLRAMTGRLGRTAGLVAVTPTGRVAVAHTSPRMAWAHATIAEPNLTHYGIEQGQHLLHHHDHPSTH